MESGEELEVVMVEVLVGRGRVITRKTGKMWERRTQQDRKPHMAAIKATSLSPKMKLIRPESTHRDRSRELNANSYIISIAGSASNS